MAQLRFRRRATECVGCVVLVAFGCGLMSGCGRSAAQAPVIRPPVVTVGTPVEKEVVDNFYFEGYTAAVSTVDIRARVTGYLSKVYFTDGQDVKEGERLFIIDPRPYEAERAQARAELGRAEATSKRLAADFARAEKLLPMRTISQEEYDRIAGQRAESAADVKAKQAAVSQADLYLHFCEIKAPISGRISRTLVTAGNLVVANETLLTTIVSIDPMYVYFDVDEPTILRLQQSVRDGELESKRDKNPTIHMALDIDKGYPFTGEIDFSENRVDPQTGTLKVRGVFPNKNDVLSPGLHARIEVPIGKPHKALMIPERAIGTRQGRKFVYVVDKKNQVAERPVTVGLLQGRLRVIDAGLKPDERIIIDGLQRVRNGVTVDPKPIDAESYAGTVSTPGTAVGR